MDEKDATRQVVARYARLTPYGKPMYCKPSPLELSGEIPRRENQGTDRKVIYSDREAAELAATELEILGSRPLKAYPCGRSRHGHYHLATDDARCGKVGSKHGHEA